MRPASAGPSGRRPQGPRGSNARSRPEARRSAAAGWARTLRRLVLSKRACCCLALALGCPAVASGPALALSRGQAARDALRVLRVRKYRGQVVVFALPGPVHAGALISDAGPDATTARSTLVVQRGFRTLTETNVGRRTRGRVWLFWADLAPGAAFEHPSVLLLIDARSGRVVKEQGLAWWPLVDGQRPAFLKTPAAYSGGRYRVFARTTGPVATEAASRSAPTATAAGLLRCPPASAARAGPVAVAAGLFITGCPPIAPPLPASPVKRIQGPASSGECMVVVRDRFDPTFAGNLPAEKQFAQTQGMMLYDASNGDALQADLNDAQQRRCADVVVAIDAHGSPSGTTPDATVLLRGGPDENPRQPVVGTKPATGEFLRGELFTSYAMLAIMQKHPGLTFKLVIDSCYAGRWITDLSGNAPPNLAVEVVSSRPDELSWSNVDDNSKPDPFWQVIKTNSGPPGGDLPGAIYNAVKLNFRPQPGHDQHPQGVRGNQGSFDGSDPQNNATGTVLPPPPSNCRSDVNVSVNGTFAPDNVWGVGTVTVPAGIGASAPQTVTNGNEATGSGSFAWTCATNVTLQAKPAMGSHFDSWSGLCSGSSPTCSFAAPDSGATTSSVVATPRAVTRSFSVAASFAPTLYNLTVDSANPDGGVASAGGSVFPMLKCGNNYNGSTKTTYTQCTSQARAARSDTDVRTISFQPNSGDSVLQPTAYQVDRVDGCDAVVYQGTSAQCSVLLAADRTVTVTWKHAGP